ncbi:hypothetical protein SAMN05421810_105261 [Amycolatopsis arida]|uniref:Uncharacterized protein n=1 Tax=Amycolatopsis arida TaxID=587909 RepID=A0A1I5WT73_9PSEU|nr:hypothetical protein CLV69_105280 [Amycolatopsis arida]SFQ22821.1 hypothetical protein SAMN05421810_105261 [Amycolatopsis arida]
MDARKGDSDWFDGATWWSAHEGTGRHGRPRPGTRVRLRRGGWGVVQFYEGQWDSITFPVRLEATGHTELCTPKDLDDQSGRACTGWPCRPSRSLPSAWRDVHDRGGR